MTAESIFLIPNGTFFFELLAFLAILYIAKRYIIPPLDGAITKRQELIKESLAAAEQAKVDAAKADDERQQLINVARNQARDIVAGAQATSDQLKSEQTARAQAEYDRIVSNADAEVGAIRQRAIDEASSRVSEVAFDLVSKVVGREVDERAHQDLVNEAVEALRTNAQNGASS